MAGVLNIFQEFLGQNRDEAAEKTAEKRLDEYYGKILGEEDRIAGVSQSHASYRGKLRGGRTSARRKLFGKRAKRRAR